MRLRSRRREAAEGNRKMEAEIPKNHFSASIFVLISSFLILFSASFT
jgi:hypothetical protein